jgi:hypothetical protein
MTTPENPGAAITINADERGIIVTGQLGGGAAVPPTRHAQALRRRAINRARRRQQLTPLPPFVAGDCDACEGWGVVGDERRRCRLCRGTGTAPA